MNNNFSYYVTKFFSEYLPSVRRVSKNTIMSYNDTIIILIKYLNSNYQLDVNNINVSDISLKMIEDFMVYLKNDRNLSSSSTNQRLAAIKILFKYIGSRNAEYYELSSNILNIASVKVEQPIIEYLSTQEIDFLLKSIDVSDNVERKHFMILSTLFDTAARVQELCDLKLKDIDFERKSILLHGKGNKTRSIPISNTLKNNLLKHVKENYIVDNEQLLFTNKFNKKLTRVGISYIINKYVTKCNNIKPEWFNIKATPHTFRHSKAVSMLEAGISIFIIRDFLGHVSVTTTEKYLRVSPKFKEKELKKHEQDINYQISDKEKVDEKDLIEVLKSLR